MRRGRLLLLLAGSAAFELLPLPLPNFAPFLRAARVGPPVACSSAAQPERNGHHHDSSTTTADVQLYITKYDMSRGPTELKNS